MTRIKFGPTKLKIGEDKETVLGLKIPAPEIEISGMELNFDISYGKNLLVSLPDAHGEFTGYYDKGDDSGTDSASASGT